jgi:hypothetical protein
MKADFNYTFIYFVGIYLFVSVISLYLVYHSYQAILMKVNKTDKDITRRQHLISLTSYIIATITSILPFLVFNLTGTLSSKEQPNILFFLDQGMRYSFFLSMFVLLADSFIRRLTSDIYVFSDVNYLNNFCLYLRSFNTDKYKQEKVICRTARNLFPVYAIGDPNHILQPNGAERFYVTDEHWKDAVENLMKKGKVIFLRVGQTDGTLWELHKLIELGYLNKTIFIVYSKDDYEWFKKTTPESLRHLFLNFDKLDTAPYAFYFADGLFYSKQINRKSDFVEFLNSYLSHNHQLDAFYTKELDLRSHSLKYAFHKEIIPQRIRESLNLQFISPIIMMNHWPINAWILFFIFTIIASIAANVFNIPVLLAMTPFILFCIIKGNCIEWASGGYSCPEFFIRIQRRKALLMWYCYILGGILSLLYWYVYTA